MEKRLSALLAFLFLSVGVMLAQTKVTGVVTSAEDGYPIIGASVVVQGTKMGAVTDLDGRFQLTVPTGSNLEFSYIGMKSKVVKASENMKVVLSPDSKTLEDVVVVGYGSARKIGTITGAVTTVNSDKLKNAPSASALDALQGQVAGLSVLSSSGEAGDNAVSMSLHGVGSLTAGSEPLYVIDGIPSTRRSIMAMNPNDIKSVTVLKDASATSIYGSRAANGVIYVTTKKGSYNMPATVTVRSQYGWSTLANKKFYEDMMTGDQLYNFWLDAGLASQGQLKKMYDEKGYRYNTKWYDVFQQFNNPQTQNDISIEGGGENVSYLVGASQFHQRGTAIGNYYDRYTFRSNVTAKPKKWLHTGMNINFSYDKNQRNIDWGNSENNANYLAGGLSYLLNPLYPRINPETGKEYDLFPGLRLWNPSYVMENQPNVYSRYGLNGNAYVELRPIKNLKIVSRVGTDMGFLFRSGYTYPSYIPSNGAGRRTRSVQTNYSHTITNTAEYSFDVAEDHHFTVLLGQEGVKNKMDYFFGSSRKQVDDKLMNLQNGEKSTYELKEEAEESRFLSFFGRVDYNLLDRYFVDFSLRNDASSRFGRDNRNANFWAIGTMWKVKNEEFMRPVKWVNSLDLKVSYGTQGNADIGNYAALGKIGPITTGNEANPQPLNYGDASAWVLTYPENPALTWEEQKLFTLGVNGKLWNRFDFDLQYYLRKTSSMLMDVPYAYTTGFNELTSNVGEMQNQGIDIKLGVDIIRTKDYFVHFTTLFNYNSEKITKLFQGLNRWAIANTGLAYVVGSPVMYYSPIYAGVDPADGAPMWYVPGEDIDKTTRGETTKDYNETRLMQNTGKKLHAPVNGGFSLSGGWKGLTLSADFSYVLGKYMSNNDAFFYNNPNVVGVGNNNNKDVRDFWTPDNPNAKYPSWQEGYVLQFDTHLLENASFLRLKSLQLGYQLPASVLGFQKVVKSVKLTFTGRNLFTVTNYSGIDPEVNNNVSYGRIGNSKQFLLGAEVTF